MEKNCTLNTRILPADKGQLSYHLQIQIQLQIPPDSDTDTKGSETKAQLSLSGNAKKEIKRTQIRELFN